MEQQRQRVNDSKLTIVPSPNRSSGPGAEAPPRPAAAAPAEAPPSPCTAAATTRSVLTDGAWPDWWPRRWVRRADPAADGVDNMAIDLALLDLAAERGVATVRTYDWRGPTVSFGRNERVRATWDVAGLRASGFAVVRRPTGGRALLHGADLTYAVALPLPASVSWRAAYAAVNASLLAALHRLGVPATLVRDAPALAPDGLACFAAPADGEIVVDGRKLVGSAVWRTPRAYLQHGSVLLRDTQAQLDRFRLAPGMDALAAAPAGELTAWCTRDAACAALHEAFDGASADASHDDAVAFASDAHRHTLMTASWLWRR
jgi:lipoate-protein ligase A